MSEQNIAYYVFRGPFAASIAKFSYTKKTANSYMGCVTEPGQKWYMHCPKRVPFSDAAGTYESAQAMATEHLSRLVDAAQFALDKAQRRLEDAKKWEPK